MQKVIEDFPKQFSWEPKIENEDQLQKYSKFIVAGMGGSSLAADLLKVYDPILDLVVHRDYGLPEACLPLGTVANTHLDQTLLIASSYSGNTEETLSALDTAIEFGVAVVIIATGGKLLAKAKELGLPYVQLPETGIQPRMATGFSIKALLAVLGMEEAAREISLLAKSLDMKAAQKDGEQLAKKLAGKVPVIYASRPNFPVAYNWKIKFNETGKIPAFANYFPELNHNEMTGFDFVPASEKISQNFHFIFLLDSEDHPRHQKRMEVTARLYEKKGLAVERLMLKGGGMWEKIFSNTLIADWAAYATAQSNNADPENVPMIEEFKKLIL
ncbi:MAG: bifunctional phosphoglucose/phosphomannose isomerase [Patescibacteria group bacterium]